MARRAGSTGQESVSTPDECDETNDQRQYGNPNIQCLVELLQVAELRWPTVDAYERPAKRIIRSGAVL